MSGQNGDGSRSSDIRVEMVPHGLEAMKTCRVCGYDFAREQVSVTIEWGDQVVGLICEDCVERGPEESQVRLVAMMAFYRKLAEVLPALRWPTIGEVKDTQDLLRGDVVEGRVVQ